MGYVADFGPERGEEVGEGGGERCGVVGYEGLLYGCEARGKGWCGSIERCKDG